MTSQATHTGSVYTDLYPPQCTIPAWILFKIWAFVFLRSGHREAFPAKSECPDCCTEVHETGRGLAFNHLRTILLHAETQSSR